MTGLGNLTKRNCKMFFKDKAMFFTSLITPIILLVLYSTFLAKVYRDSFKSALPGGFKLSDDLINGIVSGQLISSLLAVCCVTIAFCSNMLSVQDKVSGARRDFLVSPVKKSTLAFSYYLSTLVTTMIICLIAVAAGVLYIAKSGCTLPFGDIAMLVLDVFLLVMFGTALSSIINLFLNSQGQISAVGTVVSAGYGFICGAYMPISNFGSGLQKVLSFLPGTYGTSLLKNHALRSSFEKLKDAGVPNEMVKMIKSTLDCTPTLLGKEVTGTAMFLILVGSILLLLAIYIVLSILKKGKN